MNGQHKQKQCEQKMKSKTKFLQNKNHENEDLENEDLENEDRENGSGQTPKLFNVDRAEIFSIPFIKATG